MIAEEAVTAISVIGGAAGTRGHAAPTGRVDPGPTALRRDVKRTERGILYYLVLTLIKQKHRFTSECLCIVYF